MTPRTTPPFRADHVGSLLRPPALLEARERFAAGTIDAAELRAAEDEAIREGIRMQEAIGLRAATDGEMRRESWHMDFIYRLGGIVQEEAPMAIAFQGATHRPSDARIAAPIALEETIFADDFGFVRDAATTAVPKLTIPSPSMVHHRGGHAIDPGVYDSPEELWADLTAAYRAELRGLAEVGCSYLQLDDVRFAMLNDPRQRAAMAERGEDAERLHLRYIEQFNAAVAERPDGMAITTHMCRGNFRSTWQAEGSYDFVAEALLSELDVDGFFMEYDDERSGGFEPLRFLPSGKTVVLGLVTSKRGELESRDELLRRIEDAARHADLDQLCLSPQCGFSSTVEGNALTVEEQWAKLRLVVDVADEVWGA
jgi:5-methyltetrahydropteroyltriglutamate--homocysteine methyltransferase